MMVWTLECIRKRRNRNSVKLGIDFEKKQQSKLILIYSIKVKKNLIDNWHPYDWHNLIITSTHSGAECQKGQSAVRSPVDDQLAILHEIPPCLELCHRGWCRDRKRLVTGKGGIQELWQTPREVRTWWHHTHHNSRPAPAPPHPVQWSLGRQRLTQWSHLQPPLPYLEVLTSWLCTNTHPLSYDPLS